MSLAAVTSVPLFRMSGVHAGGITVAALVALETFARLRLISQDSPHSSSHLAEVNIEVASGEALLCLTALSTYCASSIGLTGIAIITLRRLYGDFRVIPAIGILLERHRFSSQFIDVGYWAVEWMALAVMTARFFVLSIRNPTVGKTSTFLSVGLLVGEGLLDIEKRFFKMVVRSGWFDQDTTVRLRARKIERIQSFSISLKGLATALEISSFLSHLFIPIEGGQVIKLRFLTGAPFWSLMSSIAVIGTIARFVIDQTLFVKIYSEIVSLSIAFRTTLLPFEEATRTAHRKLLEEAYEIAYGETARGRAIGELLSSLSGGELDQIQTAFKICTLILDPLELEPIIARFSNILTPDVLSLQENLWKIFNQRQIEQFLLTSELKDLLDGKLDMITTQLNALAQEVAEVKNPPENGRDIYDVIRPLYEQLEKYKFDKTLQILNYLSADSQAEELLSRLRQHKTSVENLKIQAQNLEEKLESLVGDLFTYAVEGLAALTADDIKVMFEECGEDPSESPLSKITEMLANQGIKWKGDLVQKGILQQGDKPDNSKVALKARLENFFFSFRIN